MTRHRETHYPKAEKSRFLRIHADSLMSTQFARIVVFRANSVLVEFRARGAYRSTHLGRRGTAWLVAACNRSLERENAEYVFRNLRRETLELRERQIGELAMLLLSMAHGARDGFVRVAERDAFAHEVIGKVGRRRESFSRGGAHPIGNRVETGCNEIRGNREAVAYRVDRVEQRFLVLLVVLVVSECLRLHQHEERCCVSDDARTLPADQLGDVGISLLRHDRAAAAEAIRDPHE